MYGPGLHLEYFPNEILTHILLSASSTSDLRNLAVTCRLFYDLFSARKLDFMARAVEVEFGPTEDAIQLVTHNASQLAHILRKVPLSYALLREVIHVGKVAARWEEIYPFKKWKHDFQERRLLNDAERRALRQALYRLWLYTRAFHNPHHPRSNRLHPLAMRERAMLLHNWTTTELAQIADVRQILREVLGNQICPSNGTISRKFAKRFPNSSYQLLFNTTVSVIPTSIRSTFEDRYFVHNTEQVAKYVSRYTPTCSHEPGEEGWGDDLDHYYVLEDLEKLDPEQVLWLKDFAPSKHEVQAYIRALGEWFNNNGATFGQTYEFVLEGRGECVRELSRDIEQGQMGVALRDVPRCF